MTLRKFIFSPTGSTIHFEYSGSTNNIHLLYLTDIVIYSGCSLYDPYFISSGTAGAPSLLSCNSLISNVATVGDYIIDWNLNSTGGTTILVSGNAGNADPSIESYHPFTGVPVPGGTLYPVIRYVYLNGYKYSSAYNFWDDSRWSPDLATCLDSIVVPDMNCGNGTLVGGNYSHQVTYNNTTMNISQATRSINFILNTGGTTKYFAWYFYAYDVPDTIKITYSGATTQELNYWTVGGQSTTNYTSTPKSIRSAVLYSIANYSGITYTVGDYLKIDITPNSVTTNTNWLLNMKCKTGATFGDAFNCDTFAYGANIINTSSINMTYVTDSFGCYYTTSFSFMSGITEYYNSDLYKYIYNIQTGWYYSAYDNTSISMQLLAPYTGVSYSNTNSDTSCNSLNNSMTVSTTSNSATLTFQDNTDYMYYKNSYLSVTGDTGFQSYTSDNTNINHYKKIWLYQPSGSSCGDSVIHKWASFHYSSPVTFNDVSKTISITMTGTTNGTLSGLTCNSIHVYADNFTTYGNSLGSSFSTNIRYVYPFWGQWINPFYNNTQETTKIGTVMYAVHPTILNNVCNLTSPWIYNSGGTAYSYINSYAGYICMFRTIFKVEITNTADPINNYKVYSGIDAPTGNMIDFYQIYP